MKKLLLVLILLSANLLASDLDILTIEKENTIFLNDQVNSDSVTKLQAEFLKMDAELIEGKDIYLVLNTPGGLVSEGTKLIDFIKGLPRKVHTISITAASMGFYIMQSLDIRFVMPSSFLMHHRVSLRHMEGSVDGTIETHLRVIRTSSDYLNKQIAERLNISIKEYKELVRDDVMINGFEAVKRNMADKLVYVRCGETLTGTYVVKENGTIYTFSKCPLISLPLKMTKDKNTY